jgi:hypothetical protein
VYPDGSQEPNPFDAEGPAPWVLTSRERRQAGYIAAAFHLLVRTVATVLHDAGVPLDHEWAGDQAVLAVLLLLPALDYKIPWDGKIDEFSVAIQPPGVSAFTPDGRSASARDGRPHAPTVTPGKKDFPFPALEHEPAVAALADAMTAQGLHPYRMPAAVDYRPGGECVRSRTCDGFPCRAGPRTTPRPVASGPPCKAPRYGF